MKRNYREDLERHTYERGRLIDLDTGEEIPYPFFFDDETGEYERYATNPDGSLKLSNSKDEVLTVKGQGRMKFVPDAKG